MHMTPMSLYSQTALHCLLDFVMPAWLLLIIFGLLTFATKATALLPLSSCRHMCGVAQAHLDNIVMDVMEIAAQLVKQNVKLVHNVDPATPVITADKKRLTQILYNLIGNALKFTRQGTVVVSVKPAPSGTEVCIRAYI